MCGAVAACFLLMFHAAGTSADTYTVTLDAEARSQAATGRVVLFFITETQGRWADVKPIDGPFFTNPQPICSVAVKDFKPGDSVNVTNDAFCAGGPLDSLRGTVRVQAILDADNTERSHTDGPGNVFSDVVTVELKPDRDETITLTLSHRIDGPKVRVDQPNLKWVKFRSELLSAFYGREVFHRAGVALPPGYHEAGHPRQHWPGVYVIPGYGGRDDGAEEWAITLHHPGVADVAPMAVYVVLDPESSLGHHGFCDSANNGPRGRALTEEFIPELERRFRLVAKPEARLVTGHSSGGWSSLWLQLIYPQTFGGCWASAPDPVDFSAFQMSNVYEDSNLFQNAEGVATPSYRQWASPAEQVAAMTVQEEAAMEFAIDPDGRSGQQWDAWEAMFSPRNPETGQPLPMFDPVTGDIHSTVLRHWARFDLTRIMTRNWPQYGPAMIDRVRVVCGSNDSYYLNRAVEKLKTLVDAKRGESTGTGYVKLIEGADHSTVSSHVFEQNTEMREHLIKHGLQDAEAPKKK